PARTSNIALAAHSRRSFPVAGGEAGTPRRTTPAAGEGVGNGADRGVHAALARLVWAAARGARGLGALLRGQGGIQPGDDPAADRVFAGGQELAASVRLDAEDPERSDVFAGVCRVRR